MPNDNFVAELSPSQLVAHKKIEALMRVYDAAEELLIADDIVQSYSDYKSLTRYSEAIGDLEAAIYNAKAVFKELRNEILSS